MLASNKGRPLRRTLILKKRSREQGPLGSTRFGKIASSPLEHPQTSLRAAKQSSPPSKSTPTSLQFATEFAVIRILKELAAQILLDTFFTRLFDATPLELHQIRIP